MIMADMGVGYRMTWGTLVDPPETADERQAAIVAWLRDYITENSMSEGSLHAKWIADEIESGEWKGKNDG
jgi:hypothetical protein